MLNKRTILFDIDQTLKNRLLEWQNKGVEKLDKSSYVTHLYQEGLNKIGKKIVEESGEVLMAAKDCQHHNNKKTQHELVKEITDLWFHCMVLLRYYDGNIDQVLDEAVKRFGVSGLEEKRQRK